MSFLWEHIAAGFLYRKFGITWQQNCFCWNLHWLSLSGKKNDKCHKHCDKYNYLRLFRPINFSELLRRLNRVCSNCESAFWPIFTVCNLKSCRKWIRSWSRRKNYKHLGFQWTQYWPCSYSNQSEINVYLWTSLWEKVVYWFEVSRFLCWLLPSCMLSNFSLQSLCKT